MSGHLSRIICTLVLVFHDKLADFLQNNYISYFNSFSLFIQEYMQDKYGD